MCSMSRGIINTEMAVVMMAQGCWDVRWLVMACGSRAGRCWHGGLKSSHLYYDCITSPERPIYEWEQVLELWLGLRFTP